MKRLDGARLRQDLEKHGSLHTALAMMESQRESLEAEIAELSRQRLAAVNQIVTLSVQITVLEHNVREGTEVLDYLDTMVERNRHQHDLVEALVAMVVTSPSRGGKSIGDLITSLQQIAQYGWFTAKSAEDLRNAFVRIVLGDYLHCFRCGKCGAKFIVNREPYDHGEHQCLTCRSSLWVEADDSFLEEMVSPGKPEEVSRAQELQKEVERLKPLEVIPGHTLCQSIWLSWADSSTQGIDRDSLPQMGQFTIQMALIILNIVSRTPVLMVLTF